MAAQTEPVVSIVMPVYNGERYIRDAVKSCLEQSFSDLELICVDDASTDGTPEILHEYAEADDRVRYVRHSENKKLPKALNTGFEIASGRYFSWTSDDNLYAPEAIDVMVSFLEANTDVDLVYAGYRRIDEECRALDTVMPSDPEEIFTRNIVGACFLYRRTIHDSIGGYRHEMFLAEDYDFWLRAYLRFRIAALDEVLYTYRVHSSALGQTYPEGVAEARRACLEHVLEEANSLDRRCLARLHLSIAQASARLGDCARTRRHIAAAMVARPLWTVGNAERYALATTVLGSSLTCWLRDKLASD